ncbi:MAG: hypothetical protein IPK60_25270 [Sandaracinaceae bacterium]|nr:hypothetical protein [Sandaracinaceae bacterium]
MSRLSPGSALRFIFVIAIIASATMYAAGLRHVIRSDGAGYYAYLPAVFIQGNLSMQRGVAPDYEIAPEWLRVDPASRQIFDKFPVGTALFMLPFFLVAHASAHVLSLQADGFSAPYQIAIAIAGIVFGMLGLYMLRRVLEQRFTHGVGLVLLAMAFGTNLFHYFTFDAVFSHVYSFFLFASFVWLVTRFFESASVRVAMFLGLVMGAIMLVRPTNAIVLLYLPLHGLCANTPGLRHWKLLLLSAFLAAGLFSIQILCWKITTGHYVVYAYGHEHFDLTSPKPLQVLFSLKKGLFFWSPLLLLATWGFRALKRQQSRDLTPSLAVLSLQLALVASWWNWWYGGSFGHRAFTEYSVFFALGLGALAEESHDKQWFKIATALGVALSVVAMALYWAHVIPYEGF